VHHEQPRIAPPFAPSGERASRIAKAQSGLHAAARYAQKLAGPAGVSRRAPNVYQPACKPGSVGRGNFPPRDGHSSATSITRGLQQPTRTASDPDMDPGTETCSQVTVLNRPYSVLLPVGFAVPPALPPTRCALTAPFHPCRPGPAISGKGMTGWSGGPFSVALSLGLHPPDVIRHRMSMEPGLSSRADLSALVRAAVRPTDRGKHGEGLGRGQDPPSASACLERCEPRVTLGDQPSQCCGG
jgi:hypothetical protein